MQPTDTDWRRIFEGVSLSDWASYPRTAGFFCFENDVELTLDFGNGAREEWKASINNIPVSTKSWVDTLVGSIQEQVASNKRRDREAVLSRLYERLTEPPCE